MPRVSQLEQEHPKCPQCFQQSQQPITLCYCPRIIAAHYVMSGPNFNSLSKDLLSLTLFIQVHVCLVHSGENRVLDPLRLE